MPWYSLPAMRCLWGLLCHAAPAPPPVPVLPPAPPPIVIKAPIGGITSMGPMGLLGTSKQATINSVKDPAAFPCVYSGQVILDTLAHLMPAQSGPLDFSYFDAGLANIDAYNASAHPAGCRTLRAEIRILIGPYGPAWLQAIDGGPVVLSGGSYPKYWTADVLAAEQTVNAALAARYDTDPRVAEVAVWEMSTTTAEPMVQPTSQADRNVMIAAGYTDAAYQAGLASLAANYAGVWQHTPFDFPFNPWRPLGSNGDYSSDYTITLMDACRAAYPALCILANHGLSPTIGPASVGIYNEFARLGAPIELQLIQQNTDPVASLTPGLAADMSEYQLWQTVASGGQMPMTSATIENLAGAVPAPAAQ